jgi:serine/threonine protein kinase
VYPQPAVAAVLLVDDDPLVLQRTENLLTRHGHDVITASNGEKGLEVARNNAMLDVAVVDYHMPGMNGLEFMMALKEQRPECRRILLSGAMDVAVVMDAVNRCGVSQVLQKPFVSKDLLDAVAHASKPRTQDLNVTQASPAEMKIETELPPNALGPGVEVAEYRIEELIGRGGMATVYGGVHPVIGKKAAIKVLNPEISDAALQERFIREAQVVNRISHPNIVDIFATGTLPDGRMYLVMEWIEGETLEQRMIDRSLNVGDLLGILDQLCAALQAAHEKGVIHRDIKSQNVMLQRDTESLMRVKLLDFGIAKLNDTIAKTRPGAILGTPHYISPEQILGEPVTSATDVYALGVLAYEMFTGRLPFQAESLTAIAMAHLTVQPTAASACWFVIPPLLDHILLSMLAKDPADRPELSAVRAALALIKEETNFVALLPPSPTGEGASSQDMDEVAARP